MLDIYNFVITNLFPNLPTDLYFIIPISCIIILCFICFACISPFLFLFSLMRANR